MIASGSCVTTSATVSTSGKTAPRVAANIATLPYFFAKRLFPRSDPAIPWVIGSIFRSNNFYQTESVHDREGTARFAAVIVVFGGLLADELELNLNLSLEGHWRLR